MNLQTLRSQIEKGELDTVVVAFPDVFGRLVGKRFTGKHFLEHVLEGGTHACNYLLAVNIEMDPLDGFEIANWERGFGDFEMHCDTDSLRAIPWLEGTALVICDYCHPNGELVAEAPRSLLQVQAGRLGERGWHCRIASELEFFLFNQSYSEAFRTGFRDLMPSSDYRIDYHTMQPARDEGFLRQVRNQMIAAGVPVECSKGEWGRGQHEINFVYGEPLVVADRHVLFKQGIKEIAAQHGRAVSFMPKLSPQEPGNSCHIHVSLWEGERNLFWDPERLKGSTLFRQFLGGLLKYSPELSVLLAPTINAYKRYQSGSWAPTKMAWAFDNRTTGFRVVGHEASFRIENRMPGADANPYLAFAATLLAGLAGIEEGLDCGTVYEGNAYIDPQLPALPESLQQAGELWEHSEVARRGLGQQVVDFYRHTVRLEVRAYQEAVTDWELARYFERI